MKSAYDIAMARLEKSHGPSKKLTEAQKARIAEIEKKYEAKVAEQKLALESGLASAKTPEELDQMKAALAESIAKLEAQREQEKQAIWDAT